MDNYKDVRDAIEKQVRSQGAVTTGWVVAIATIQPGPDGLIRHGISYLTSEELAPYASRGLLTAVGDQIGEDSYYCAADDE